MRLFKKGNKITFFFKFYQYTHHLRGVMVGILLKILPHAIMEEFLLLRTKKPFSSINNQKFIQMNLFLRANVISIRQSVSSELHSHLKG